MNYVKSITKISAVLALLGVSTAFAAPISSGQISLSSTVPDVTELLVPQGTQSVDVSNIASGGDSAVNGLCFYSNATVTPNLNLTVTTVDQAEISGGKFSLRNASTQDLIPYSLTVVDHSGSSRTVVPNQTLQILGTNTMCAAGGANFSQLLLNFAPQYVKAGNYASTLVLSLSAV